MEEFKLSDNVIDQIKDFEISKIGLVEIMMLMSLFTKRN